MKSINAAFQRSKKRTGFVKQELNSIPVSQSRTLQRYFAMLDEAKMSQLLIGTFALHEIQTEQEMIANG